METKKILVYGYFGYLNGQLDGQTIKTRNIYELLKRKNRNNTFKLDYFDSQIYQKKKLSVLWLLQSLRKYDIIIFIGAKNNLLYIFPFFFVLSNIFKFKLHYVLVGGWLEQYASKPLLFSMLKRIIGVYPQTYHQTTMLKKKYGFNNVTQIYNFRLIDNKSIKKDLHSYNSNNIKIVFMARVHPKKGIKTLFQLENKIMQFEKSNLPNVQIDIYGPVLNTFESEFFNYLQDSKIIQYKGVLQPTEIYSTLANYDLMLFPTEFYTEGFPGSVLDAYHSGIPIIATEWKYAHEFIENGFSGIITKFGDTDMFISETIKLIMHPEKLNEMRSNIEDYRKKFDSEEVWKILKLKLNI